MASPIEEEIAHLRGLELARLRARWRALMGRSAPAHLPRHLLLRILVYRVQARRFGDLAPESIRFLQRLAASPDAEAPPPTRSARAGTVLIREWEGVHHHVMSLKGGYAWNGGTYRSLSQVAHAITGTKWNGPRFFGLRGRPGSDGRTVQP